MKLIATTINATAAIALLTIMVGGAASFSTPHGIGISRMTSTPTTTMVLFMLDFRYDDNSPQQQDTSTTTTKTEAKPQNAENNRELQRIQRRHKRSNHINRNNNNNNDPNNKRKNGDNKGWFQPEPPEDLITGAGDIASLFLYAFTDYFINNIVVNGILASSTSAADAAKALDPSGTTVSLASTPVWLDVATAGPQVVDQVLFWDLQSRVTPHYFSPLLESPGTASVALASCWIVAGLIHKAFHFRNTLECSTQRAVFVAGQTWVTASALLLGVAILSGHLGGGPDATNAVSTAALVMEGRSLSPIEEWFSVLTRSDAEYIVNSLGTVLTWRFLISYLLGGWSK